MRKLLFFISILTIPFFSQANSCFEFYNLTGSSNTGISNIYTPDGFTGKVFEFRIDNNNNVIHDGDLKYSIINGNTIIGLYNDGSTTNIETWTVDKKDSIVFFNRTRIIPDSSFTNSGSFVGDLKNCNY